MQEITLDYVKQLVTQLSYEDQQNLTNYLEQQLRQKQPLLIENRKPQSLRGIWQEKFSDEFDIDAALYEIRHEWEKEWPEVFVE